MENSVSFTFEAFFVLSRAIRRLTTNLRSLPFPVWSVPHLTSICNGTHQLRRPALQSFELLSASGLGPIWLFNALTEPTKRPGSLLSPLGPSPSKTTVLLGPHRDRSACSREVLPSPSRSGRQFCSSEALMPITLQRISHALTHHPTIQIQLAHLAAILAVSNGHVINAPLLIKSIPPPLFYDPRYSALDTQIPESERLRSNSEAKKDV
ncbi:hypothetical protein A4X13_0g3567 [Tilletia indica]|uniref:Uncharacterized protein n=1 Tax=Tilletia indica TaxID=43049 RepID=A0A177TAD2_9BASI|nr:hypothetical protein A4X13_0g3567 [Tilletia indica]